MTPGTLTAATLAGLERAITGAALIKAGKLSMKTLPRRCTDPKGGILPGNLLF